MLTRVPRIEMESGIRSTMTTSKNSSILSSSGTYLTVTHSSGRHCHCCATKPRLVTQVVRHPVIQAQEKKDVPFPVHTYRMFLQNLLDLREVKIRRKPGSGIQKNIPDSFGFFEPTYGW